MTALHVFDMDGTLLVGSTAAIELYRELGSMAELHELERQLINWEILLAIAPAGVRRLAATRCATHAFLGSRGDGRRQC